MLKVLDKKTDYVMGKPFIPMEIKEKRSIAIYGKGGIGKSTTTSNLAAAASMLGLAPMVVGCDPKADSIQMLVKDKFGINTVLNSVRDLGSSFSSIDRCVYEGFNGITCVESGGPRPGVGCAGKGVAIALELLKEHNFFNDTNKLVIFDVLGDVVCGGFAQPMRANFAKEVYVVTSGEYMSVYQAVNIASSIMSLANDGIDIRMAGIICNKRNVDGEAEIIDTLAEIIGVPVIMTIPRSGTVQEAESLGQTVIEAYPDSRQAHIYYDLARRVYNNDVLVIPQTDSRDHIMETMKNIIQKYGTHSNRGN